MHTICRLSRRWHQQFHLSASLAGHGRCLQEFYPVRHYARKAKRQATAASRQSDDLVVREFDQYRSDISTRVQVDPKADLKREGRLVQAKLKQLDEELALLRHGPFGAQSELMQSLPVDEREQLLKALEAEGLVEEQDDLVDMEELDRMLESPEDYEVPTQGAKKVTGVTLRIPQRQKAFVRQFNKALQAATEAGEDIKAHLSLFKWYLRCQQHVPGFSSVIPEDVWQTLWKSQTTVIRRPRHTVMLGKDVLAADVALNGSQWVQYIDALQTDGDTSTAITTWERYRSSLRSNSQVAPQFWSLGVRLCATLGRPQKAQDIAFQCLEDGWDVEPQILVPVIAAWGKSQNPSAQQKAWTCYLKLKAQLGHDITTEIYDSISSSLLKTNHTELALAVFKDMVLAEKIAPDDSTIVYQKALNLIEELQSEAVTEEHVNRISLSALVHLPKQFHNKFFFGSWIKKLIGLGEIDGATKVVELMVQRGIRLDANHLNGIVGAWLRESSLASRKNAEKMAWAMIQARIEMVQRRNGGQKTFSTTDEKDKDKVQSSRSAINHPPPFQQRAAPAANIETFSILLQHYTRHTDIAAADNITNVLVGPAQMTPNAFIMNHWLYAALRVSDIENVWLKYVSLKDTIAPDLETFVVLWDAAKIQYDRSRAAYAKNFPIARDLFAEMITWLSNLTHRNLGKAKDEFSDELYNQIVRCFCLSSDLPGTLCCLHGLKYNFDHFPDDTTTRLIMIQVSRLLPADPGHRPSGVRGARRKVSHQKKALSHVTDIIQNISFQHEVRLSRQGIDLQDLNPQSKTAKLVRLDVLTEFLLGVMTRSKKIHGDVEEEVRNVAKAMGVDVGSVDFSCLQGKDDAAQERVGQQGRHKQERRPKADCQDTKKMKRAWRVELPDGVFS